MTKSGSSPVEFRAFLSTDLTIVLTFNINWETGEVNSHGNKVFDGEPESFREEVRKCAMEFIKSSKKDMGKAKRSVSESKDFPGRGISAYLCRRKGSVDDYFVVFGDTAEDRMIMAINDYGREVGMEENLINKGKAAETAV
jgi:hypothetical protein